MVAVPHCDPRCWRGMPLCLHPPSTLRLLHSHMIVGRMAATPLPEREHLTICFAHVAYRLGERFALRNTGIRCFELRTLHELEARIGAADVLVVSGLWRNELLDRAKSLRFIQSISAGTDQYAREALRARGIRLASAQGANERAVAEHAMALIRALARQLPQARDHQARRVWRGMSSDPALRSASAETVLAHAPLLALLPPADFVPLTCPLTPQTQRLIGAEAFAAI